MTENTTNVSSPKPRAYYLFATLWLAVLIAFVDKTILSLMLPSIQIHMNLSDSSLGFLAGAAFGITYMMGALVNSTLGDYYNRVRLIVVFMAAWSLATLLCGIVPGIALLVLCRAVVGYTEGGLNPIAASLVSDVFPRRMRASMLSILFSAVGTGIAITYIGGGPLLRWLGTLESSQFASIAHLEDWQLGFISIGIPGLILSIMMMLTVREPERTENRGLVDNNKVSWREVFKYLNRHRRLYLGILIGMPLAVVGPYALLAWVPVLFTRVYGWDVASIGLTFGLTCGPAMILGSVLSGRVVSALRSRGNSNGSYLFCLISSIWLVVFSVMSVFIPHPGLSIAVLALAFMMFMIPPAMMYAVISEVAPNQMRARIGSLSIISAGLLLNSAGPWAIGLITDHVFGYREAVGLSFVTVAVPGLVLGALILVRGISAYASAENEKSLGKADENRDIPKSAQLAVSGKV